MKHFTSILTAGLLTLVLSISAAAQTEEAADIMRQSHLAYYYAANDGVAEVTMTIPDKRGCLRPPLDRRHARSAR